MDIFAQATRLKVRFTTTCGTLSVEDLWDLPLTSPRRTSLDDIARSLFRTLQEMQEVSFVEVLRTDTTHTQLRFDVVKYIIEEKKAERLSEIIEAEKAAKKAKLLDILSRKQDAALEEHSVEELQEMLASL